MNIFELSEKEIKDVLEKELNKVTLEELLEELYEYDECEDILYISIDEPTPSITEEVEEGILLRRDMKTNKITGVTILDYKDRLIEWLEKRDFSLKIKDTEVTSKMAEMIEESNKKKNFISNLNAKEKDNKIVTMGVQEELNLANNKKAKKQAIAKWDYIDEYKLLEDENNKLRFYSAYNIINQKTKELLNIIYCNKSMELDEFKNKLINSFRSRNRKNKNLSYSQKNEYANNKYETIKDGLQFLNIIEISDDNKIITLTSYGKTFVEEYIEKEVGENEH